MPWLRSMETLLGTGAGTTRTSFSDLRPPLPITAEVEKLLINLHDIGAVKFGSFTLKSGIQSPIYVDLRTIVSYPKTLALVARLMQQVTSDIRYDVLCGVPYTALPIATAMSLDNMRPMVMRRREKKEHGLGKMIEGCFSRGDECLVVEDLVSSGSSIMETVTDLREAGIKATHAVVLLDRQQGGVANLVREGVACRAVTDITTMVQLLCERGRLDAATRDNVLHFIRTTPAPLKLTQPATTSTQPTTSTTPLASLPAVGASATSTEDAEALELPMSDAELVAEAENAPCSICGVSDVKEDIIGDVIPTPDKSFATTTRLAPSAAALRAPAPALPPMVSEMGLANVQRVMRMSYEERAALATNGMARMLLSVIAIKKTNLCLSADVTTTSELITLARACGPHIAMLKTHADIIDDFTVDTSRQLREIAQEFGFVLLEDRKIADIGNTSVMQVRGGVHRIASWAHAITAHSISGVGVLEGIQLGFQQGAAERAAMLVRPAASQGHDCQRAGAMVRTMDREHGVLLLAQMSSAGNLIDDAYTRQTVAMAQANPIVCGFIAQERLVGRCVDAVGSGEGCGGACGGMCGAGTVIATPGVQVATAGRSFDGDKLRQQYNTPRSAILRGSDVIIVGRGIIQANDPTEMAERYREEGWRAYLERTGQ